MHGDCSSCGVLGAWVLRLRLRNDEIGLEEERAMGVDRSTVLNARHRVASAHGAVIDVAGHVARALAWQVGDEAAVIADLEVALTRLGPAQRMLHEAITELRIATIDETKV